MCIHYTVFDNSYSIDDSSHKYICIAIAIIDQGHALIHIVGTRGSLTLASCLARVSYRASILSIVTIVFP